MTPATTLLISIFLTDTASNFIPGPNLLMVVRQSLRSRFLGFAAVAGLMLANAFLFSVAVTSTAFILDLNENIARLLKIAASAYLFYLGWRSWFRFTPMNELEAEKQKTQAVLESKQAFLHGFLVCVTNPKALLYFATLGMVLLSQNVTTGFLLLACGCILLSVLLSYGTVAIAASNLGLRRRLFRYQAFIEKAVGSCFVGFGVMMFLL